MVRRPSDPRHPLALIFIADERLVVPAAIEYPADFEITGRQHHVDDDDTPLESQDANPGAKVVAQSADFGERFSLFTRRLNAADIAVCAVMATALPRQCSHRAWQDRPAPQDDNKDYARLFDEAATASR